MGEQVRVADVATIEAFRASVLTACDAFRSALDDAGQEVSQTVRWVQQEQVPGWKRRIRKCQDEVVAAKSALYRKTEIKATADSQPSVVDERKALERAIARLRSAEEHLRLSERWAVELPRQGIVYQGAIEPMRSVAEHDVPRLANLLGRLSERLAEYLQRAEGTASLAALLADLDSIRRDGEAAEAPRSADDDAGSVPGPAPDGPEASP